MILRLTGTASLVAIAAAMPAQAQMHFNRVSSFPVALNLPEGADLATETSAEIIDASGDGTMLVYSDSPAGAVGLIDITDPASPKALGGIPMEGEPTAVATLGQTVFVGVNTSASFTEPSGRLAQIDLATRAETGSCDLGGQPDSVAVAPDGSFVAVAIENERDEEVNDGAIPQLPPGFVAIVPLADGAVDCAGLVRADLTGLAGVAAEDPEPEFIDVNAAGEIAVTLQENNHIAILGRDGAVIADFTAGAADLEGIDTVENGAIGFTESLAGVLREPDAVKWLGTDRLVTANEGDWQGGSRGLTVFGRDGTVLWESGAALEHAAAAIGHYPEGRSDAKGIEPEGMELARFGPTDLVFALAERASIVGVYRTEDGDPVLQQLLPSGVSPEGAVAIPSRGLFATANEVDLGADGGARSHVMLYELQDAAPAYPSLTAEGATERFGWGALSGLAAHPETPGLLYAVSDSVYAMEPAIFEIDATAAPARITRKTVVTRAGQPAQKLDLEGIAPDGEGGFWLASEGDGDSLVPHALIRVDGTGEIVDEIAFPAELAAAATRFGAEGVTVADGKVWIAIQREWGDDPDGQVKLLAYDPEAEEWGAVRYPLDPAEAGWVGLSEVTARDGHLYVVERDNQIGAAAKVKLLYRVPLAGLAPAPLSGALPLVTKEPVRDFLPDLAAPGGYVADKLEGFAIDAAGNAFAVTDNDGVEDSSGETHFMTLGPLSGF